MTYRILTIVQTCSAMPWWCQEELKPWHQEAHQWRPLTGTKVTTLAVYLHLQPKHQCHSWWRPDCQQNRTRRGHVNIQLPWRPYIGENNYNKCKTNACTYVLCNTTTTKPQIWGNILKIDIKQEPPVLKKCSEGQNRDVSRGKLH